MPLAFSLAMSAYNWSIVVGGELMPAFWNRSLRYQNPTTCVSYGRPYRLPFSCQPAAAGPTCLTVEAVWEVMSATRPDRVWVASRPRPG